LNGFFQGWGWPPCARSLCNWYSQNERGRWWAVWNTSHNVGGGLIPLIAAYCAQSWGWRYAMYVPGIIAILVGFFLMNRLRDSPKSMGLPNIEEYRNDNPDVNAEVDLTEKESTSKKDIIFKYVLKNKYIWILGVSYALVYFVRTAVNDWGTLYLTERGYSLVAASSCVSFFEIGGFFGSLVAGWGSDLIFSGKRGPMNVIFSFFSIFAIGALYISVGNMYVIHSLLFFLIGFFIFGPQMLIGMAAAELSHKEAAGASTGFVSLFAYLGAALSAYPVGKITQHYGWIGFFIMMAISLVVATLCLLPLWSAKTYLQMKGK
jgi:OPA family sugar phosphate sensor protein UhpC-like MFS transporter